MTERPENNRASTGTFKAGKSGNPAGRPKGVPNKLTAAAKDAIADAAARIGGTDRLVAWVEKDEKNEAAFWTSIYPKLLPLQVQGDSEHPLYSVIEQRIVDPERRSRDNSKR